MFRRTENIKGI